jgi:hypothetical protein
VVCLIPTESRGFRVTVTVSTLYGKSKTALFPPLFVQAMLDKFVPDGVIVGVEERPSEKTLLSALDPFLKTSIV